MDAKEVEKLQRYLKRHRFVLYVIVGFLALLTYLLIVVAGQVSSEQAFQGESRAFDGGLAAGGEEEMGGLQANPERGEEGSGGGTYDNGNFGGGAEPLSGACLDSYYIPQQPKKCSNIDMSQTYGAKHCTTCGCAQIQCSDKEPKLCVDPATDVFKKYCSKDPQYISPTPTVIPTQPPYNGNPGSGCYVGDVMKINKLPVCSPAGEGIRVRCTDSAGNTIRTCDLYSGGSDRPTACTGACNAYTPIAPGVKVKRGARTCASSNYTEQELRDMAKAMCCGVHVPGQTPC